MDGTTLTQEPNFGSSVKVDGFAVASDHAFFIAVDYSASTTNVYEYLSGSWSSIGQVDSIIFSMWASLDRIVLAGQSAVYVRQGASDFVPIAGAPAGDYAKVWGFGSAEIWAGNHAGQLVHYDGTAWSAMQASQNGSGVTQLWGIDGQLYFATLGEFGRWNGTALALLTSHLYVTSIWGRSNSEVFLTVQDPTFAQYKCGESFVLWFDGSQFHQF
ncbi:MAG TPA: hypothetical protein VGI10_03605 [Polyangiaceae bacterium]